MYEYKVIDVPRIIDGDTFDLDIDLGFYASLRVRIRLFGIDTYEIFGRNAHPLGLPARRAAQDWIADCLSRDALHVITFALNRDTPVGDGSFGRWQGVLYDRETKEELATVLRKQGFEKTI